MKLLVPLTAVVVMAALMFAVESAEKPQAQNRQMGFVPGGGGGFPGYAGGSGMSFYHPAQAMMGMPMQMSNPMAMGMGMGMGMPSAGGVGAQMYQRPAYPQMQQPFMNPYQQGGQGGMFPPPIRYTQYPAISNYGAPQMPQGMPAQDQLQDEEEYEAASEDEAEAEAKDEAVAAKEDKPHS